MSPGWVNEISQEGGLQQGFFYPSFTDAINSTVSPHKKNNLCLRSILERAKEVNLVIKNNGEMDIVRRAVVRPCAF